MKATDYAVLHHLTDLVLDSKLKVFKNVDRSYLSRLSDHLGQKAYELEGL